MLFDTFCRLPNDVTNMIMSYICRPKFEFKIDEYKSPHLIINSIGSKVDYYLPENDQQRIVDTNDIKNILIEDCGQYELFAEHRIEMTFTIDEEISIDNNSIPMVTVDIGSLPSLRIAISEYLNYLSK